MASPLLPAEPGVPVPGARSAHRTRRARATGAEQDGRTPKEKHHGRYQRRPSDRGFTAADRRRQSNSHRKESSTSAAKKSADFASRKSTTLTTKIVKHAGQLCFRARQNYAPTHFGRLHAASEAVSEAIKQARNIALLPFARRCKRERSPVSMEVILREESTNSASEARSLK